MGVGGERSPCKGCQEEGERTPSPGHPKQASCRHPLGTDSKSKEELAWDFAKCTETSWGSLAHMGILLAATAACRPSCLSHLTPAFKFVGKFQLHL